jgi:hypothetical protein
MTGEMEVYRAAVRTSDGASFPRPRRKPTTQFSEVPESLQQISISTLDPARRRNWWRSRRTPGCSAMPRSPGRDVRLRQPRGRGTPGCADPGRVGDLADAGRRSRHHRRGRHRRLHRTPQTSGPAGARAGGRGSQRSPVWYATMRDAQAQPSNWGVEPASGRPVVPNHFRSSRAAVPSWYIAVIALFTASQPSMSPLRKPTP